MDISSESPDMEQSGKEKMEGPLGSYECGFIDGIMGFYCTNYLPYVGHNILDSIGGLDLECVKKKILETIPECSGKDASVVPYMFIHHGSEKITHPNMVILDGIIKIDKKIAGKKRDLSSALAAVLVDGHVYLCVYEWCTPVLGLKKLIETGKYKNLRIDRLNAYINRSMVLLGQHFKEFDRVDDFVQIMTFDYMDDELRAVKNKYPLDFLI